MFKWKNKFAMETLWDAENEYIYDVNEIIKINNQYYAKLDYEQYNTNIKLTKKEDKITKMTCDCQSRKRNCKHLAETLFYIEKYEIPEKKFKHNSLTKYKKLSDVEFEKYLSKEVENIETEQLQEFLVNILIDYEKLYKNYILAFKNKLNDNDIDIILKKLNNILKIDIDVSIENDKFYDKLEEFLNDEMIDYSSHKELSYKIYMKIYEKIVSVNYLLDTVYYSSILSQINTDIISNLETINFNNKNFLKTELNRMLTEYPDTLFSKEIIELIGKLSDDTDYKTNINLLIKQIETTELESEKEEFLTQLRDMMEENNYSIDEIIENLEKYSDNYHAITLLLPYYTEKNDLESAVYLLEQYIKKSSEYDENIYPALIELKNLQYKIDNLQNFRFLIIKLVYEYDYYNEQDFKNLKNIDPEWEEIKTDIIHIYQQRSLNNLYQFYILNDMNKELEETIFSYPNIDQLKEYQEILIKTSKKKLINAYEEIIYDLLKLAKRSKYRKVAKILNQMKEIPGTQSDIRRIKKDIQKKYPKRKALLQEIKNI